MVFAAETRVIAAISTQSKVNKSKVNKSKVNKIKDKENINQEQNISQCSALVWERKYEKYKKVLFGVIFINRPIRLFSAR